MKRVALLEGRAISIGRNLSFHPIISLLKNWTRIKEEDSDAASFEKLEKAVKRVCLKDADDILPFVAILMGMKLSGKYSQSIEDIEGDALQKHILKNVKDILTQAAAQTPLVIVMEDLHWADTSSIELLESLFRIAEIQRIIFINVFRPDHHETGDRILETLKERPSLYSIDVQLKPLDEKNSETLIHNMMNIEGLHHRIKDQIIQRSGGNPFFIEEVVRSFIDEGVVVKTNGAFETTDKINQIIIPHTINDVLMARIDRLEEKTRNLIKVASVIGRNFFYRILASVTDKVDDIDDRLSYLQDIQIIREQNRMEELEYLFKHALAQEAAYSSILGQKRKQLHLMVADSIETVFQDKVHEFYGMLAFHYSKGENLNKTEHYLIKAGEESLKASASSEALHFYQEALGLYLKQYGNDADPEKIAMIEKNIALAFYNKGQYIEAVEYFDKVLTFYGEKIPNNHIVSNFKFLKCFLTFLISLYFPFLKWKKIPTNSDKEIISLFYKKCTAVAVIDPAKMFIESFYLSKNICKFDLNTLENGSGMIATVSSIFSWPGISFTLSQKVISFIKSRVNTSELKSMLYYKFAELIHNCLKGNWKTIKRIDDNLIKGNLSLGEFFYASNYLLWRGFLCIEQGNFHDAQDIIDQLKEIADVYENDYSRILFYTIEAYLLMKFRKLNEALAILEEGVLFCDKTGFRMWLLSLYSLQARVHLMLKDFQSCENLSISADNLKTDIMAVPLNLDHFLLNKLILSLDHLEESIKTGGTSMASTYEKEALHISKAARKNSRKIAQGRTETFKQTGILYWLGNKQRKALNWWQESIKEGERLGARLELSRTYFEVGKRLLEPQSKYKSLNNISAEEYLKKAETLFKEMALQWDLDELEKVKR